MNKEDFISGERLGFKKNEDLFFVNGVGVDLKEYKVNNPEGDNFLKTELKLENDAVLITCVAELSKRKNQFFFYWKIGEVLYQKLKMFIWCLLVKVQMKKKN